MILVKRTISRIRNNKHIICEYVKKSSITPTKVKRLIKVMQPKTEKAYYEWFLNERLQHSVVNDNTGQQSKWPKYKNNCLESMLLR